MPNRSLNMLDALRSILHTGTTSQRILILGCIFFVVSLVVDVIAVDVFANPNRPGTTLTRRSLTSYASMGFESLLFGALVHLLEAKTRFLSFEPSE